MSQELNNEETMGTEKTTEEKLSLLQAKRDEIIGKIKKDKVVDSHFFHISQNLFGVAEGYFNYAIDEGIKLSEKEISLINKKLNLIERYFSLFEDPWFEDKELYQRDGAFSDGKTYSSEDYIPRAERLLQDRHLAEQGLA
ncbi:MAG: hypothetical protein HZA95_02790 [Candidatus Vogelbacteria bacterium]|nr:hypothetical protein [Candidatus Vogelbacteria bacterium]